MSKFSYKLFTSKCTSVLLGIKIFNHHWQVAKAYASREKQNIMHISFIFKASATAPVKYSSRNNTLAKLFMHWGNNMEINICGLKKMCHCP